jgi:hypothetical protein
MNLYFVSLERKILRIVSVSRYNTYPNGTIIIKYIYFSTLPLLLDFMHPVRRSDNPSVIEKKKAKRDKKRQRKGKICQRFEREELKLQT